MFRACDRSEVLDIVNVIHILAFVYVNQKWYNGSAEFPENNINHREAGDLYWAKSTCLSMRNCVQLTYISYYTLCKFFQDEIYDFWG
jgi:hypothetical protein